MNVRALSALFLFAGAVGSAGAVAIVALASLLPPVPEFVPPSPAAAPEAEAAPTPTCSPAAAAEAWASGKVDEAVEEWARCLDDPAQASEAQARLDEARVWLERYSAVRPAIAEGKCSAAQKALAEVQPPPQDHAALQTEIAACRAQETRRLEGLVVAFEQRVRRKLPGFQVSAQRVSAGEDRWDILVTADDADIRAVGSNQDTIALVSLVVAAQTETSGFRSRNLVVRHHQGNHQHDFVSWPTKDLRELLNSQHGRGVLQQIRDAEPVATR